ncbi:MAG TPA: CoA pyrophosphatase [Fulvivirga sp.]|nr:CoA pyrophosphatase [Fulvivirga sp.]
MNDFLRKLEQCLREPLPGHEAHRLMMPKESSNARFDDSRLKTARPSSVLILFYEKKGELYLPLTQRQEYDGIHSGQVSFPGGKWEKEDKDLVATAKRETFEEIGVNGADVNVIGQLSEMFIPPSNTKIMPIVGYTAKPSIFVIDPYEVKELMEVPLAHLLDDVNIKTKDITVRGNYKLRAPYFDVDGKVVWGATAMMLSELVSIINRIE